MMRSLFSGVAGLKTHQTRMDVIGNNIANVNTTAYKAQTMVFSDLLYQQTQAATGANAATGRGGTNPRQIGLGSKTAAISTAITRQGSAQSTNNPFDIMITGESFFIVNNGTQNFFTRDGAFTIDGAGNLVMASTGYKVMGWQVDPATGDIRPDVVSALQVMNKDNLTVGAESTTRAYASGILDKNDTNVHSPAGRSITLAFNDNLGYTYTAKLSIHSDGAEGKYRVRLDDIIDEDKVSLVKKYGLENINQIASFGGNSTDISTMVYSPADNAKVENGNGTTDNVFSVTFPISEVLDIGSNALLKAAGDKNIKLKTPADGAATVVDGTTTYKVNTSLTLSKNDLEGDPYNLIYYDGAYWTKDTNAPADATPDKKVSKKLNPTDVAAWGDALKSMKGLENVKLNTINVGADGSVTLDIDAECKALTVATRKGDNFESTYTDEKDILKYVYNVEDKDGTTYTLDYVGPDGRAQITATTIKTGFPLEYDTDNGKFLYIGTQGSKSATMTFNPTASTLTGDTISLTHFSNIDIDFSASTMLGNGKVSTIGLDPGAGDEANTGAGRKYGELIGIEVGQDGKITASYDNGISKLLGQIAVANFANASGLAKAGNNLYSATSNSGEFDGTGSDITADGGSMESGVLEMSNVDLSAEFTEMITTQRGFQANSRIITTSDSLLEELVNLKR
ncbi:flagellar hook-basal body complex protein [bacterium 0.1xD8-71]|nr:flagellar hook-basal body complex protein [bacterium 0.1xD8-71]